MPFLKRDVYSTLNPSKCYGRAGQEIVIVRTSGNVMTVRHKGEEKEGFPCLVMDVVDNREQVEIRTVNEPAKDISTKKGRWNKGKGTPEITQKSLF